MAVISYSEIMADVALWFSTRLASTRPKNCPTSIGRKQLLMLMFIYWGAMNLVPTCLNQVKSKLAFRTISCDFPLYEQLVSPPPFIGNSFFLTKYILITVCPPSILLGSSPLSGPTPFLSLIRNKHASKIK